MFGLDYQGSYTIDQFIYVQVKKKSIEKRIAAHKFVLVFFDSYRFNSFLSISFFIGSSLIAMKRRKHPKKQHFKYQNYI